MCFYVFVCVYVVLRFMLLFFVLLCFGVCAFLLFLCVFCAFVCFMSFHMFVNVLARMPSFELFVFLQ